MADGISRRGVLGAGLVVAGGAALTPLLVNEASAAVGATAVSVPNLPWPEANQIVNETLAKAPSFPDAQFVVTDAKFGAKGDGKTDNTAAFRKAVDACNAAGGGHVVVPKGDYVTGAVYLKSNVDLHLQDKASRLLFSGTAGNFPTVLTRYEGIECMNRSPMIYAFKESNIALTGPGTLDAAKTSSWNKGSERAFLESLIAKGVTDPRKRVVPGSGHNMRSTFVEPYQCDRVLIQGVTLKNPMFWQLHPTLCTNVIVDGVHTDPSTAHSNTDGCDPESCDHVVIVNCNLGAHDDNIAIKSGRDADGRRINKPTQNVVVAHCVMNGNWGAITCGSEQTGGIRNVYAFDIDIVGQTKFALYVKSNTLRGGFSQNINLDSVHGAPVRSYVFVTTTYNNQTGKFTPKFGPFRITNSSCTKAPRVFDVSGLSQEHVKGFTVSNCNFDNVANASNHFSNTDGISFTNVKINGKTVTK